MNRHLTLTQLVHYTKLTYDNIARQMAGTVAERIPDPMTMGGIEMMIEMTCFPKLPPMILEIGCGVAQYRSQLKSRAFVYSGIDISPVMIERARALDPTGHFHVMDFHTLDFPNDFFDCFLMIRTLQHIARSEAPSALAKLRQTLRPGAPGFSVIHGGKKAGEAHPYFPHTSELFVTLYGEDEVRQLFTGAGFEICHYDFDEISKAHYIWTVR